MEEINTIVLENNGQYSEVSSIVYGGRKYVLLSNVNNVKDICIRKIITENGKDYVCRINDEEFKFIFNKFVLENKSVI